MSILEVVLEIPDHILEGLETGVFERVGGVIRKTDNSQIVMWLRDVGLSEDNQPSEAASQMAEKLGIFSNAGTINMGLSLINLGVNVAGFAFIANKINEVQDKLIKISLEINEIRGMVESISRRQDLEIFAELKTAIDIANRAISCSNNEHRIEDLRDARKRFTASRNVFYLITNEMKNKGLIWKYFDSFYLYTALLLYSILAEVKCSLYLGEDSIARCELDIHRKQFSEITVTFLAQPNPFNTDFLAIHSERIPELTMMRKQVAEGKNFLDGMQEELNFLDRIELPYLETEKMIRRKEPKNGLVFMLPVEI